MCKRNVEVKRQILLPLRYEKLHIEKAYKLDLLIENSLVVELKSLYPLPPAYFNQLHTYLSLLNLKHGLLVNFKVPLMKEGMHRVFNNLVKK